ncbi:ATP-binding cassette domain-containing protein [Sneathiella glossodoripedis]|uniref:ATP-binding cassette domain-containing protein n=1 Tax=Sneathiella glossodoripedis TaxID=418853 RepID=UPI00046FE761|nr:ATP-binding cassette domain-containing protein [Sneathiella glossodoripedis]
MDNLISARNVSVERDGKSVLKDVSVSIGYRDFITIIGPNGAGKSMLLKCLMGFYTPDRGSVTQSADLKIGYVPQRLVADHSIPITVERFLKLRKLSTSESRDRVIAETEIGLLLRQPLSVLSGGELQRVLLARALLDNPTLLVLDEPAQNLDVTGQLAFYKLIERIYRERNVSILMVSHDLHLVMSATRNVLCLSGEVCCYGEPSSVAQDPAFITLFGEDMAKMMASYHHHDHEQHHHNHGHEHPTVMKDLNHV